MSVPICIGLHRHLLRVCNCKDAMKQIISPHNLIIIKARCDIAGVKIPTRCVLQPQQKLRSVIVPQQLYSQCPSTDHAPKDQLPSVVDPFKLVEQELCTLYDEIKAELVSSRNELQLLAQYYFDGKGKAFRPTVIVLVSKALNFHTVASEKILPSQRCIAMIAEMLHTASLVHDDVIDASSTRRGKDSAHIFCGHRKRRLAMITEMDHTACLIHDAVDAFDTRHFKDGAHVFWGHRKAILSGDFILSAAYMALARVRNERVVSILSQVLEDLVRGEFMQLGSKENEDERFAHYLKKTFKKTASLIANSCRAVAILGNCSEQVCEVAYLYGRNIGIAFQLIDDLLDFTSCEAVMGKPTAADLRLGLATAPVLFAAQEYSELNPMIMRRFSMDGDVRRARDLVAMSDGVAQTRMLAEKYSQEAIKLIRQLTNSKTQIALEQIADLVLKRRK